MSYQDTIRCVQNWRDVFAVFVSPTYSDFYRLTAISTFFSNRNQKQCVYSLMYRLVLPSYCIPVVWRQLNAVCQMQLKPASVSRCLAADRDDWITTTQPICVLSTSHTRPHASFHYRLKPFQCLTSFDRWGLIHIHFELHFRWLFATVVFSFLFKTTHSRNIKLPISPFAHTIKTIQ